MNKLFLSLIAIATLTLTSCSKDSNDGIANDVELRQITLNDLQGEWRLNGGITVDGYYYDVYLVVDGNTLWVDVDDANGNQAAPSAQYAIYVSNGVITTTIPNADGATIVLVGNQLIITLADGTVETYTKS